MHTKRAAHTYLLAAVLGDLSPPTPGPPHQPGVPHGDRVGLVASATTTVWNAFFKSTLETRDERISNHFHERLGSSRNAEHSADICPITLACFASSARGASFHPSTRPECLPQQLWLPVLTTAQHTGRCQRDEHVEGSLLSGARERRLLPTTYLVALPVIIADLPSQLVESSCARDLTVGPKLLQELVLPRSSDLRWRRQDFLGPLDHGHLSPSLATFASDLSECSTSRKYSLLEHREENEKETEEGRERERGRKTEGGGREMERWETERRIVNCHLVARYTCLCVSSRGCASNCDMYFMVIAIGWPSFLFTSDAKHIRSPRYGGQNDPHPISFDKQHFSSTDTETFDGKPQTQISLYKLELLPPHW